MRRDRFVPEFLSFLERREARLLGWGFFDIAFDIASVESLLQSLGPADLTQAWLALKADSGVTMGGLIDDMAHDGLLHILPDDPDRFRTRFAEGVRLSVRLRQLFRPGDWATAPRLVSDIKLDLRPRSYPKRDQSVDDCWNDIAGSGAESPVLQAAVFDALARDSSGAHYGGFAGFQRRAFARILSRYGQGALTGSVISAGTGSGKTKAAYVPAFLGIAADIERDSSPFTKLIAVYPRNVLLADQLREALAEAAKIAPLLSNRGLRPITFAALTGDTPPANVFGQSNSVFLRNWKRQGPAYRLPSLKSPRDATVDLLWRDVDRNAGVTALYAANDPNGNPHVADGVIRLTRDDIRSNPPDVLLLSIEMLHRELGNPAYGAAFGTNVKAGRSPRILLLDEIHTYEGLSGAQIPWVLRRWFAAARPRSLQVVGLSATLRDARGHLSVLSGIAVSRVEEFRPHDQSDASIDEVEREGQEYNLVVKGNAASGASLLATSIQCAMLMSRLLTPRHVASGAGGMSDALFARKVFGFTDNLDGLNRWYADLYDAEHNRHLARLRAPDPAARTNSNLRATERLRREEGQIWDLPVALGHDLVHDARVDRCSSQDAGLNAGADIVVATSSLEVGYDDPDVGTMLHHKTPRSTASFLQRKGRAGRRRGTRPTTVVVLSDYGVDRWSFQNSERLFDPSLDRIALPVLNPHVVRVQATAFLLDWLGRCIGRPDPFNYLRRRTGDHRAQDQAQMLLNEMLDAGPALGRFRTELIALVQPMLSAQGLSDQAESLVDSILWDEPRPVLWRALPALLRKLEAQWSYAEPRRSGEIEDAGRRQPIPEFLPSATFAPLEGVEVAIRFPAAPNKEDELLSVARALSEACPGRVSKRFSVQRTEMGYWLAASSDLLTTSASEVSMSVAKLFPERMIVRAIDGVQVQQPLSLALHQRPINVADASNARWRWKSELQALDSGSLLPVFLDQTFAKSLGPTTGHLHREGGGIRVLRYASSAHFDIAFRDGRSRRGKLRLETHVGGSAEAVGFEQTVDGIRIDIAGAALAVTPPLNDTTLARLKPEYFLHLLQSDDVIAAEANPFMIGWLWQTSLAMLGATAVARRCGLREAQEHLRDRRQASVARVLDRMFGGIPPDDNLGDPNGGGVFTATAGSHAGKERQRDRLLALWGNSQVLPRIEKAESVLWATGSIVGLEPWLRERHLATIAQAIRAAALAVSADVAEEDLIVDVANSPYSDSTEGSEGRPGAAVFLTETGPGGLGQIEAIVGRIRSDPEGFEDAFCYAIDHCPREDTTTTLLRVLEAVRAPSPTRHTTDSIAAALAQVRSARGHSEAERAREALSNAIDLQGIDPTRDDLVAILGRLARPGSAPATDALARGVNQAWRRHELNIGLRIDPRVFGYLCVENRGLRRRLSQYLRHLAGGTSVFDHQLYAAVQGMLLTGCHDSCPECIDQGHVFDGLAKPNREVAREWLDLSTTLVEIDPDFAWLSGARSVLRTRGRVAVHASPNLLDHAARGIQMLMATEIEREFVMAPVSLAAVARSPEGWTVLLRLRAASHV